MDGRAGNDGASWRGMLPSSNQTCVMRRKQGRLSKDGLYSWIAQGLCQPAPSRRAYGWRVDSTRDAV
jgi:hypothetical protein